jgi:uncharacterized cupin superfamily protein
MEVITSLDNVKLGRGEMDPSWVISGVPATRSAMLDRSRDGLAFTAVWECPPSEFNWHYDTDEVIYVLAGKAALTCGGKSTEIGPGTVVTFRADTVVHWHVIETVRKFAVWRHAMPRPLGKLMVLASRIYWKLVRVKRHLLLKLITAFYALPLLDEPILFALVRDSVA